MIRLCLYLDRFRGKSQSTYRFGPYLARKMLWEPKIPLARRSRTVKQSLPGVLAVAGASVFVFRKSNQ